MDDDQVQIEMGGKCCLSTVRREDNRAITQGHTESWSTAVRGGVVSSGIQHPSKYKL